MSGSTRSQRKKRNLAPPKPTSTTTALPSSPSGLLLRSVSKDAVRGILDNLDRQGVEELRPFTVQVVTVKRFLVDGRFAAQTEQAAGPETAPGASAYDVVLSDGACWVKCLLAQPLRPLVQRGELAAGTLLRVTGCHRIIDETDVFASWFVLISAATVLHEGARFPPWTRPSAAARRKAAKAKQRQDEEEEEGEEENDDCDADAGAGPPETWINRRGPEDEHTPSMGSRKTYVDLASDCDPPPGDPRWASQRPKLELSAEEVDELEGTPVPIRDVIASVRAKGLARAAATIVGRVVRKSELKFLGRSTSVGALAWPAMAYFGVQDGTGEVTVVLWFSMARLLCSLRVGDVVALDNYRVKTATTYAREFSDAPIELSMNSRNPAGRIRIVPPLRAPALLAPNPTASPAPAGAAAGAAAAAAGHHRFVPRSRLAELAHGDRCDVAGMVVAVGRPEVIRMGDKGLRTYHRWVELVDPSSERAWALKLCSYTQRPTLDAVRPGMVLTCTDAAVHTVLRSGSHGARHLHARSTRSSQIDAWFHDQRVRTYTRPHPGVDWVTRVVRWTHTAEAVDLAAAATVGGFRYWPFAPLLDDDRGGLCTYKDVFPFLGDELRVLAGLAEALDGLHLHQVQTFVVQGTVAELCLVDGEGAGDEDEGEEPVLLVPGQGPAASAEGSAAASAHPSKRRNTGKGRGQLGSPFDDPYAGQRSDFMFGERLVLEELPGAAATVSTTSLGFQPTDASGRQVHFNGWWRVKLANLNKNVLASVLLGPPTNTPMVDGDWDPEYASTALAELFHVALPDKGSFRDWVKEVALNIAGQRYVFGLSLYRAEAGPQVVLTHVFPQDGQ